MLDSPRNEGTRIAIELPLVALPTEISAGGPKSGAAEPE
jgi:hypothetical protein